MTPHFFAKQQHSKLNSTQSSLSTVGHRGGIQPSIFCSTSHTAHPCNGGHSLSVLIRPCKRNIRSKHIYTF